MAEGFTTKPGPGGVYYLTGVIDESAKFDAFDNAAEPLKLNLKGIKSINSLGVRALLAFLKRWQPRTYEYHECPLCFVDTINILPQALGEPPKPERAKSFFLPFICPHCQDPIEQLVNYDDLKITGEDVQFPDYECQECSEVLDLDGDPDDYFLFITCPA